jgi:hypothetical protein
LTGQDRDKNGLGSASGAGRGRQSAEELERALAAETSTSASLREALEKLRVKAEQMEATLTLRLDAATIRSQSAESRLAEQHARLEALGQGREETMRALADARAELARVRAERDQLRQQLTRGDGMTATLVLPDDEPEGTGIHAAPPSIDELMASFGSIKQARTAERATGHLHLRVEDADVGESQEMLAPEIVFGEEFSMNALAEAPTAPNAPSVAPRSRFLVRSDSAPPIKYPIYKDEMTIGRAETADIQVQGEFVSRVHVRVLSSPAGVVVEDVSTRNGIRVNAENTKRTTLKHGDVLAFGHARFTFIDPPATELELD